MKQREKFNAITAALIAGNNSEAMRIFNLLTQNQKTIYATALTQARVGGNDSKTFINVPKLMDATQGRVKESR